jgi:hypothetical protein
VTPLSEKMSESNVVLMCAVFTQMRLNQMIGPKCHPRWSTRRGTCCIQSAVWNSPKWKECHELTFTVVKPSWLCPCHAKSLSVVEDELTVPLTVIETPSSWTLSVVFRSRTYREWHEEVPRVATSVRRH